MSSSLDRLSLLLQRGDVDRAEAGLDRVRELIGKAAGWHEWIGNLRFTMTQAKIGLERADFCRALARLAPVIKQEPRRQRVKYQILGLLLRARAFAGLAQPDDGGPTFARRFCWRRRGSINLCSCARQRPPWPSTTTRHSTTRGAL